MDQFKFEIAYMLAAVLVGARIGVNRVGALCLYLVSAGYYSDCQRYAVDTTAGVELISADKDRVFAVRLFTAIVCLFGFPAPNAMILRGHLCCVCRRGFFDCFETMRARIRYLAQLECCNCPRCREQRRDGG